MPSHRRWLLVILAVALALRLGWTLTRPADDAAIAALPDQAEYLSLARNLLSSGTLSFHDPRFDQTVHAYRTPGYPWFVAATGASIRAVRIAQALVDTSTVLAVYLLTRRLLAGHAAPLAAAALVALNPLLLYFTGLLLTETLFTACLAWGFYLSLLPRAWIGGVLLLTFGVLVRPSGLGLAVLLPAAGLWLNRPAGGSYPFWRSTLTRATVAAALLLITLGLWSERNNRLLGQRVWLTTNEGITRYDGFNPDADGSSNQSFVDRMPRLRDMTEIERDETLSQLAASYISAHPARVAELAVRKTARTWSPVPLSEQFGSAKYVLVGLGYTLPLFLLTLAGLYLAPLDRLSKFLLLSPALYFTVVHAFSVGSLRYRVPAEPEMAVLAGAALACLFQRAVSSKQPVSQ